MVAKNNNNNNFKKRKCDATNDSSLVRKNLRTEYFSSKRAGGRGMEIEREMSKRMMFSK